MFELLYLLYGYKCFMLKVLNSILYSKLRSKLALFIVKSTRLDLDKQLRINISEKTQRFDVAMTSFSSDEIKLLQCEVIKT